MKKFIYIGLVVIIVANLMVFSQGFNNVVESGIIVAQADTATVTGETPPIPIDDALEESMDGTVLYVVLIIVTIAVLFAGVYFSMRKKNK